VDTDFVSAVFSLYSYNFFNYLCAMPVFNAHTKTTILPYNMAGMLLCTGGQSELQINGTKYKFSRGSMCFVDQFVSAEIVSQSDDCHWEMISFTYEVLYPIATHVYETIMRNRLFKNPYIKLDGKQIKDFLFYAGRIRDRQRMLEGEPNESKLKMVRKNIVLLQQTAIIEFTMLYFDGNNIPTQKASRNETIAYDFVASLVANFSKERSVGLYAKQVGLTTNYFSQIVHQYIGYTPTAVIKNITIANAKMLLADTRLSIKEITVRLNFPSQISFCKYFKTGTGMSPSEYRKTMY